MTPTTVLSHFSVGDTVQLKGAMIDKTIALFIGDVDDQGYYYLWNSKAKFEAGAPWQHVAAGSHLVVAK